MSINTIPINALPIPKAQPRGGASAHYSKKADDVERFLQTDNPADSKLSRLNDNNELTQSEQTSNDTNLSDKITADSRKTDSKHRVRHFKDVVAEKIQSEDSSDKAEGQTGSTEAQSTESSDNAQQKQPAEILNTIITASAGQQAAAQGQAGTEDAANSPNILITGSDSAKVQTQKAVSSENQQVSTQQNQAVSDAAAKILNAEIAPYKEAAGMEQVASQTQKASQTDNKGPVNIDLTAAKQTKAEVKADVSQINADSQKQHAAENSNNTNAEVKPADAANQGLLIQAQTVLPKEQSAVSSGNNTQIQNPVENNVSKAPKPQQQVGQNQETSSNDNSQENQSAGSQDNEGNKFGENTIKGGLAQRLGVEKVELVNGNDGSPNSSPVNFATLISHGNLNADGTTPVNVINSPVKIDTAGTTAGNETAQTAARSDITDTAASIREQIYQSIQNAAAAQQGNKQITIQLYPPELGRVSIKFNEKGAEVTGIIETSNSQTRAEIRNAVPDIIRSLEQSGINIKRIDVTLSDLSDKSGLSRQANQEAYRENYSQQLWDNSGSFNQEQGQNYAAPGYFAQSQNYGQTGGGLNSTFNAPSQSSSSDMLLDVLI